MSDDLVLYIDDDGKLKEYDGTYDLTIHCESQEEQDRLIAKLRAISYLPFVDVKMIQCKDCARNADNGGLYDDGKTRCPIQEHYALLQDGYCHLAEPYQEEK